MLRLDLTDCLNLAGSMGKVYPDGGHDRQAIFPVEVRTERAYIEKAVGKPARGTGPFPEMLPAEAWESCEPSAY